jgi:hypothetical protein
MKGIFTIILLILFGSVSMVVSQDSNADIQSAKTLLDQIVTRKSEQPGWDEPATVIESGRRGLRNMPDFVALEKLLNGSWSQIVENVNTVATSEVAKAMLFVACQSLRPDDYLQFLNQAVGRAEQQVINKRLLKWGLFGADKNVRGVLDYNYEKPIVRDILQRVKVLYANDRDMVNYCNATLSGETKRKIEQYFNDNPSELRSAVTTGTVNTPPTVTPAVTPAAETQTPTVPVPSATPIASSAPVAQTPVSVVCRKSTVWPWVVGILALFAIVAFALKRRSP